MPSGVHFEAFRLRAYQPIYHCNSSTVSAMNSKVASSLLLVAAVLALAGIGFLPVSVIQSATKSGTSTYPYYVTNTQTYLTISTSSLLPSVSEAISEGALSIESGTLECAFNLYAYFPSLGMYGYQLCAILSAVYGAPIGFPVERTITTNTTYWIPFVSYIPYTFTRSSTVVLPASEVIGLSHDAFIELAAVVTGVLGFLTAWAIIKRPRNATK
jgi:hypothetical protein